MASAGPDMTPLILNLGCGTKTSDKPGVINLDWSIYLRIRTNPLLRTIAPLLIRGERWARYQSLPNNILAHDLKRGIPFADGTVDAVYHSHFLEHLPRSSAESLLREAWRVLKPGGIQRIVVPDFALLCRRYLDHLDACSAQPQERARHEEHITVLLDHLTRQEVVSTSRQPPLRRWLENKLLGDARKRGDAHQWMYDEVSLAELMKFCGFTEVRVCRYDESNIPDWNEIGLDMDTSGGQYAPDSLYVEGCK